ncbi:MAG: hypothetical protein A2W05_00625 [Candidatus Schekmanbacteria bacterium RBG_16_38_10]|uniref:Polymerase nucleotidyl transferase domain-containing protein n=1 Tax=Candidatus Schekmanbacteria bacterium RBG_16_38_10 TaxID=1817879 RepID=A0A1F7RUU8_9BACT|nr:MAG: hypothetical protein A2W05_00625 [Candidatus Schekmanbacteria bacterium RBG_16_38_10]
MDRKIYLIITKYKQNLEALGIKVKKIILYGSYVSGKIKEESDIDLVVVSDSFRNMDLWERLCLLGQARMGIKIPIEIIGLDEEEFNEEHSGTFIGDEVKAKGVEII